MMDGRKRPVAEVTVIDLTTAEDPPESLKKRKRQIWIEEDEALSRALQIVEHDKVTAEEQALLTVNKKKPPRDGSSAAGVDHSSNSIDFYHVTIRLHPDDDGILTTGLIPLLLAKKRVGTISCTSLSTICHVQQTDKWSCGFRNLQMLLCALLPIPKDISTTTLPSIRQLQHQLELSWKQGFDPEGAQHYQYKLIGKKAWLGAVEVASLLTFRGYDATVVQFVVVPASREMMIPFCVAYFALTGKAADTSSRSLAKMLLAEQGHEQRMSEDSKSNNNLLPLYLQWKGHSVTVVGVERTIQSNGSVREYLLVLDPATRMRECKNNVVPFRLTKDLRKMDCQVIVVSRLSNWTAEENCRTNVSTVTAASNAVQAHIKRRQG